jgi:hypothetical protein
MGINSVILGILKVYSPPSIPIYMVDWLGFHNNFLYRLFNKYNKVRRLRILVLRDGTRFLTRLFSYDRTIIDEIFIHKAYTPNNFSIKKGDVW